MQSFKSYCTDPSCTPRTPLMFIQAYLVMLACLFCFLQSAQNSSVIARKLEDTEPTCPMDFSVLQKFLDSDDELAANVSQQCQYALQGLHLVEAEYLRSSGRFLPPVTTSQSCWRSYQKLVSQYYPSFDIRSACGFETESISRGCMNITTRAQFEALIPQASIDDVRRSCDQSLENNSPCATCTTSLSRLRATYLTGRAAGNVTDCVAYPFIYAGGLINSFGPADKGTAVCLFLLETRSARGRGKRTVYWIVAGCIIGLGLAVLVAWQGCRRYRKWKKTGKMIGDMQTVETSLHEIDQSTTLVKYTFDDIKESTRNFGRQNIIGRGGYGNVYKGTLSNGCEVAVKRFKNCSAAGDASFTHEVEVIASIRHVNLVALRGYCTATTPLEGHQRIIVCDLMRNGSLHDHLFGSSEKKLSWPVRQKIAIGTARGLAYLHYGAQPAIIHRDIKASNILLDDNFEPKVGDFGLAKFTPEGITHLSTRVAGTMGYVAPEYALYGQLSEKSDVYSYGVVLLELLSGKKALNSVGDGQNPLLSDWAWSMVRKGRALDVIEEGVPELGSEEVVEKYVLLAVLCSHPQLHARPTMDQIVRILETDLTITSVPDRPIPLVAHLDHIHRTSQSPGPASLCSPTGYRPFTCSPHRPS